MRAHRAKGREESRETLREVLAPMRDELARYQYADSRKTAKREVDGPLPLDDLEQVIAIRSAASGLRAWRRLLIDRRLRRVYGDHWVDLCRDYPSASSVSSWLAASLNQHRADGEQTIDPAAALIHRTYWRPQERGRDALARELRLISRGGL